MTERVQKAIDIFLDAINKGILAKGSCRACAVGNLVAHGLGVELKISGVNSYPVIYASKDNTAWGTLFFTNSSGDQVVATKEELESIRNSYPEELESAFNNIKATDFTLEELMKIENAFETNTEIFLDEYYSHSKQQIRKDQIKGLEAVVKVMMTFDDIKEDVKEVFTNKALTLEV